MRVTVKLIGIFQTGRFKEAVCEYPTGICARKVVEELLIPDPLHGILLINEIHADIEEVLHDGDTLYLLPLIDGG